MILHDGEVIDRETARHKFGGDPMAEYLHRLSCEGMSDEWTGDAIDWNYCVHRFGKRLLFCFPSGFVDQVRLEDEQAAIEGFEECQAEYDAWLGDEE